MLRADRKTLIRFLLIAQVETLLKTHDPSDTNESANSMSSAQLPTFPDVPVMTLPNEPAECIPRLVHNAGGPDPQMDSMMDSLGLAADETFSWELISLGLDEPLPTREAIDDMYEFSPPLSFGA
jgi:hypothetical protein